MESPSSPHLSTMASTMDRVAALYRDHLQFVWNVLWRARTPFEDMKDLAQDVFLVVMRKVREDPTRPGLDADEERAWLYRITIYQLSNHRSRARFRKTDLFVDNETPNPRNDAARLEDGEQLLSLLDSIKGQGRAVFELVELEGFTVVAAAKILEITESNAHKRLALARADVDAAAAKLSRGDKDAKKRAFLMMPFGVGSWLHLRNLQSPPEGTAELMWDSLRAMVRAIDRENDRRATPGPEKAPARPRALAERWKGPLGNVGSACLGGAIVALLFLLPPRGKGEPFPIPVPVFVVTSSTTAPAPLPATSSLNEPPTTDAAADAAPTTEETIDEETQLIRQARAAFASNNRQATIEALDAYERRFPGGRFANGARKLRKSLPAAARK